MKKLVVKDKRLKKILDKGGRKGADKDFLELFLDFFVIPFINNNSNT